MCRIVNKDWFSDIGFEHFIHWTLSVARGMGLWEGICDKKNVNKKIFVSKIKQNSPSNYVTSPNLLGDFIASIPRHWLSFKSFLKVELKKPLIKTRLEKRFLKIVCIVLILNSEQNHILQVQVHIFCATTDSSKVQNIVKKSQHRDFQPSFRGNQSKCS